MTTTPSPARRTPLAIFDIVVAVVLALIGALIGYVFLAYFAQFAALADSCSGVAGDGLRCAPGFLATMQILGYAVVIFGWFVTTGFIVVRILRRKPVFFLPLLAVLIMIVGFYVLLGLVSGLYLPAS
ncbi:hypothetical protein BH09ACT4_BH09ACT4_22090 [soil metagenome]